MSKSVNEPTLLSLTIGTLHKELTKAREEVILRAIDAGYGYFEWHLYSNTPNLQDLYGKAKQSDQCTLIARITYNADFRGLKPLEATIGIEYKVTGIGRRTGTSE